MGGDKVRPALSLVGYEEELRPAMAYVFGSTFICDTLQIAKQVQYIYKQYTIYMYNVYSVIITRAGAYDYSTLFKSGPL